MSERKSDFGMNAAAIALGISLTCIGCALWALAVGIVVDAPSIAKAVAVLPAALGICFFVMSGTPLKDGFTGWWKT